MKTTVKQVHDHHGTFIVHVDVEGLSNVQSMCFVTRNPDTERYNSDNYLEDHGWLDGTSYISSRYSFGDTGRVEAVIENVVYNVCAQEDILEDEFLDYFFIVLDAGNGKSLALTNSDDLYAALELDYDDAIIDDVIHIVCGGNADDMGIDEVIGEALIHHPKTRGFSAFDDEMWQNYTEDELMPWGDYIDFHGYLFSDEKLLKKGGEYFEMFRAIKKLVSGNPELFPDREKDMVDAFLDRIDYCNNIPDNVQLIYQFGKSNKFYNVELNHTVVLAEWGAVGKTSSVLETEFETVEEAKAFMDKKVLSKLKSGYVLK